MTTTTVTCPAWCVEHGEPGDLVGPYAHRAEDVTHSRRHTGESMLPGTVWAVDLYAIEGSDDPPAIYTGDTGDAALTPGQARAMARALLEAADALDAASA